MARRVLEYNKPSPATIVYPTNLYSRSILAWIPYTWVGNIMFWNIEIAAQQKCSTTPSLYPRSFVIGILHNRLRTIEFWTKEESNPKEIQCPTSLYSRSILNAPPYKRLRNTKVWDIEIPAQQGLYLHEPGFQKPNYLDPV